MATTGPTVVHDGKSRVRVYFLDMNYRDIRVPNEATAQQVIADVLFRIGLKTSLKWAPYFALHESLDGATVSRAIPAKAAVVPITVAWQVNDQPAARLILKIHLFMASLMDVDDRVIRYLLTLQTIHNVVCGIYPTSADQAVQLAATQLQSRFGEFKPDTHKVGSITTHLRGLIPASLLPTKHSSIWETTILAAWKTLKPEVKEAPNKHYVQSLREQLPFFGCELFPVVQEFHPTIASQQLLAVGCSGLLVLDGSTKSMVASYSLVEMYRWGYRSDGQFYVELKKTVSRPGPATQAASATRGAMFQFVTREGRAISDHLTAYALQLVAEIKARQKAGGAGKAPAAAASGAAAGAAAGGAAGGGAAGHGQHDHAALGLALRLSGSSSALERAAVVVQAVFRGYKLRSKMINEAAATKIQAFWRGCKGREEFDKLLEEALEAQGS